MIQNNYVVNLLLIFVMIYLCYMYYRINRYYLLTNPKIKIITCSNLGKRGNLGNQLFQLACLISTGIKNNAEIVISENRLNLEDLFNLDFIRRDNINIDIVHREYSNYEDLIFPEYHVHDIRGYRQCWWYFRDCVGKIRELLKPRENMVNKVKSVIRDKNYICVHIRRGDYIKKIHKIPMLREFAKCKDAYFDSGVKILGGEIEYEKVILCTDSREEFENDTKFELSKEITGMKGQFSDFLTMYLSKGLVISNSTYSWWAGFLGGCKVVCPSPWWDRDGFIGESMGLDGPYFCYDGWIVLNSGNGRRIDVGEIEDRDREVCGLFKLVRGMIV